MRFLRHPVAFFLGLILGGFLDAGHADVTVIGSTLPSVITATSVTSSGPISGTTITGATYATATNCASKVSPAVCGSASAGHVTIFAATTTMVVNTTAITANSQVFLTEDSDASVATRLAVTCNVTLGRSYVVTARTAGTSFTITTSAAPVTDPACLAYNIVN